MLNFEYPALYPRPFDKGATIAVIAPSSPPVCSDLERGMDILKDSGFNILDFTIPLHNNILLPFLNGTHESRLNTIVNAFKNPEIDIIWCARGGYGLLPVISEMPWGVLKDNPKLIIGFSDISLLLNENFCKTGIIGLHGPMLSTLFKTDKQDIEELMRILDGAFFSSIDFRKSQVIKHGHIIAPIIGGNLSTIVSFFAIFSDDLPGDIILFIEDINEPPYRIHRLLTQIRVSGILSKCRGLLLGNFSGCEDEDIRQIVTDVTMGLNIPIVMGLPFGHGKRNTPIPVGMKAELNTKNNKIIFSENIFGLKGVL